MPELPFVAEPPGDGEAVQRAAESAATTWGLPQPQAMRVGMNALFTAGDDVMLRIGRTTAPPEQAVWLAGELAGRGVRLPRHLRPPLVVEGLSVFAVERVHTSGPVEWGRIGEMVRAVHAWSPDEVRGHHPLPHGADFPWWQTEALLHEVEDLLDAPARAGLHAALAAHRDWRALADVAGEGLCHGDVHPGNVLQASDGPVLLDWDLLCTGPVAWDHAALITWEERWGGEPGVYARFAEGYGRDLAHDPLARSLATLRNVAATLMRVRVGRTNPAAREEAERRLRYWRGDPDAPQWGAM